MKHFLSLFILLVVLSGGSTLSYAESLPKEYGTGIIVGRVVYQDGKPAAGIRIVAEMQRAYKWRLTQKGLLNVFPVAFTLPNQFPF